MTNDTSVLIMAAGQQRRFGSRMLKQLLPLPDGSTVLGRQLQQLQQRGYEATVVASRPEICRQAGKWFVPKSSRTLCDSILSASRFWHGRTVVLLGDVVFTQGGIDTVFSCQGPVNVVGNEAEMYALVFIEGEYGIVAEHLERANRIESNGIAGKLRYFYESYASLPLLGPHLEPRISAELNKDPYRLPCLLPELHNTILVWLRDKTNDIDSMDEYTNMSTLENWPDGEYK